MSEVTITLNREQHRMLLELIGSKVQRNQDTYGIPDIGEARGALARAAHANTLDVIKGRYSDLRRTILAVDWQHILIRIQSPSY